MTKIRAALALTILAACAPVRIPPPPGPTPAPEPTPPSPICTVGQTCGCFVQPPGQDWQALPPCGNPAPTPPPVTVPPVLTVFPVRFPAQGVRVYTNNKGYSMGFDATPLVEGDNALCKLLHGDLGHSPCHFDSRVWSSSQRADYEGWVLAGARDGLPLPSKPLGPVWQFRTLGTIVPCHDDQNQAASCDHFGNTVDRDDPKTREFEGLPAWLVTQSDNFGPYAGFFTIAHGDAEVRACPPLDTAGPNCGPWLPFNH